MESTNNPQNEHLKPLFCSQCGEKLKGEHSCNSSGEQEAQKAQQSSNLQQLKSKRKLKEFLQKISWTTEENTNAILAVAQAERVHRDKIKLKESLRDQLANYKSQALAVSLSLISPSDDILDMEDDEDDYSYDSKLLRTDLEDVFAFLNKSIGKHH